ncbi:MAG TPA: phage baseplate assembly protein V [Pyrinomonadaceae bacterium]|jgi:molybdopterin-binding protein|nr:phage baseplate assembly protein V [Pyrinomonadaceae bacterium]
METEFEDQLVELSEWRNEHYYGIYRGTVESVEEGDNLGIISVKIPDVFGPSHTVSRVRPCSPFAGDKHGFVAIPEPGDGVWIQFEAGKTSLPVWIGFWWASGEIPEPKGKLVRSFITTKGHKFVLDDDQDEVTLLHSGGAEMKMTGSDVTITIGNASIEMSSSEIKLAVGPTASLKITSSEIAIEASPVGSVKLTSSGVEIANGAMKIGA